MNYTNKIVLGTAQFGMSYGISNQKGKVKTNEIQSILDFAHNNSINTLDTAKAYGNSESSIGNYLKQTEKTWYIITKISDGDKNLIEQIQNSKERLTVLPTIILAHSANLFLDPIFQSRLQEIKDKKLVHSIGVSLYSETEINQVLDSKLKPDIIQLPLNILDTRLYHSGKLFEISSENIKVHVRSVFLQGLFYLKESALNSHFPDVVPIMEKLNLASTSFGLTVAELSLLWVSSLHEVEKVIIGIDSIDHLRTHLGTLKKNINTDIFSEALSIRYQNELVLNPSLWI